MDSSGNRPYEHDTSVAVIARERGLAGPGVQALPIIGTGETEAVLAAHSTMVQSSASISAWEASHPIWTPEVPTKAKAWFPIASWLALTGFPAGGGIGDCGRQLHILALSVPPLAGNAFALPGSLDCKAEVHVLSGAVRLLEGLQGAPALVSVRVADPVPVLHLSKIGEGLPRISGDLVVAPGFRTRYAGSASMSLVPMYCFMVNRPF